MNIIYNFILEADSILLIAYILLNLCIAFIYTVKKRTPCQIRWFLNRSENSVNPPTADPPLHLRCFFSPLQYIYRDCWMKKRGAMEIVTLTKGMMRRSRRRQCVVGFLSHQHCAHTFVSTCPKTPPHKQTNKLGGEKGAWSWISIISNVTINRIIACILWKAEVTSGWWRQSNPSWRASRRAHFSHHEDVSGHRPFSRNTHT